MAYTTTQLAALQAALASGELRVTFEGRSVEYRSIEDLMKAIAVVEDALNAAAGTPIVRQIRMSSSSGF